MARTLPAAADAATAGVLQIAAGWVIHPLRCVVFGCVGWERPSLGGSVKAWGIR